MQSERVEVIGKFGVLIFMSVILLLLCVYTVVEFPSVNQLQETTPTSTISPAKQVTAFDLPLEELWRWSGVVVESRGAPNLTLVSDKVILALRDKAGIKIVVFNAITGNTIWAGEYIERVGGNNLFKSLAADDTRVYAGTLNNVQAFDLDTGQLLWTGAEQPWDKHGLLNVFPKDNRLEAYSYYDYILYVLDASTGELLEKSEYPGIIIKMGDTIYGEFGFDYLWAKNITEEQVVWEKSLGKEIQLWPIFIDDILYVSAGANSGIDNRQIFAISIKTGEIVWQTSEGFISNIALGKNTIYAIRGDATIVGLGPKTGRVLGEIKMIPSRTYQDNNGSSTNYIISATDKFLAVYYDNSKELIVFRQIDESMDD